MSNLTIPVRLLREHDRIVVDGRLVEVTAAHPQWRLGDERRQYARTYEVCWKDVDTWAVSPGVVYPSDFEFELAHPATTLETAV